MSSFVASRGSPQISATSKSVRSGRSRFESRYGSTFFTPRDHVMVRRRGGAMVVGNAARVMRVTSEHAPESAFGVAKQVASTLFKPIPGSSAPSVVKRTYKVTVVGVGNVGMACAQTILTQDLCDEIALVDVVEAKLKGEMMDLQHAAAFLPRATILADTDYRITAGSDICIVTAGARQREGESRLALVEKNVTLFKSIIPQLVEHSPETLLLVISNPVDALTYVAYKLSGLPPNRVIGSGTNLDSSRFRFLLADRLAVNAQNVHGYIVGEHGDSSVPLWSSVSIGGVPLIAYLKQKQIKYGTDTLQELHRMVVDGAYEVIKLKGYTSWAIGYSVASLVKSMLRDQRRIHPVSVCAQGFHGIEDEVFLSLPAEIGRAGILGIMDSPLTAEETVQLQLSAKTLHEIQKKLDIPSNVREKFTPSPSSLHPSGKGELTPSLPQSTAC